MVLWYSSPASGSGVVHGVLVGLRRRLGSPRATRRRRSRGAVKRSQRPHHSALVTSIQVASLSEITTNTVLHRTLRGDTRDSPDTDHAPQH